jgi:putative membrane protein
MWWRIVFRWLITAIAVAAAVLLIPGITVAQDSNTIIVIVAVGAILATVNVFIRPILQFLSCGCIIVTLGLFMLVINAGTLWLSSWMAQNVFGIGFHVDGFWPAFWGGLVISVVSFLLSIFIPEPQEENLWDD